MSLLRVVLQRRAFDSPVLFVDDTSTFPRITYCTYGNDVDCQSSLAMSWQVKIDLYFGY